jgi:hypothetical protein
VADPLRVIPQASFCVIGTRDVHQLWEQFNQGNLVWDALNETEWAKNISDEAVALDSMLTSDPEVNALLTDRQCWFSLIRTQNKNLDYVFSVALPTVSTSESVKAFFRKVAAPRVITEKNYNSADLMEIGSGAGMIAVCIDQGVVSISDNEDLLRSGNDQLSKNSSLVNDTSFQEVLNTSNETSVARIFVNYQSLSTQLKSLASATSTVPELVSSVGTWGEFDMNMHSNSVFLNGFSTASDSLCSFPSVFHSQSEQPVEAPEVLPSSTVSYVSFALSNFDGYLRDREKYLESCGESDDHQKELQKLKSEYDFSPSENFGSWIGNEFAQAVVALPGGELKTFALVGMADVDLAKEKLAAIGSDSSFITSDSSGYVIHRMPVQKILSSVFGSVFADLDECYYTFIEQFAVFAPDEMSLRSFITYFENKATLDHNSTYADFKTNLSETANITAFISPGHCLSLLTGGLDDAFAIDVRAHDKLLKRFDGCVFQLTNKEELNYISVFLRHNPQGKKSLATLWELPLDTTFSGRPYLVRNHKTKGLDIFLQDDANTIYLVSSTGTIFWKKKIDGRIIGDVQQVDALKNGKFQLAFNTASKLYVIDRNGNDLEHFPVKFSSRATNPVYVLDYDNNQEYRFLVACADKKIYNYNIKGAKVDGWKIYSTKDTVTALMKRIIVANKDYVITVDRSGNTYFTDRQGNSRLDLTQHLGGPVDRFFVENGKDPEHTYLVSCDTNGNISKLSMTDELERLHFSDFTSPPDFYDADINGDGNAEYIFTYDEHFTVFNKDKKPVIDKTFGESLFRKTIPIIFDSKDIRFALMTPSSHELHLVNKGGEDSEGFPMNGGTLFAVGKLGPLEGYTLICGNNGHYLEALPLP